MTGISAVTWALEALVSISWLVYGALHANWVVMAPEIIVIPLCASVWWMSRHGTTGSNEPATAPSSPNAGQGDPG